MTINRQNGCFIPFYTMVVSPSILATVDLSCSAYYLIKINIIGLIYFDYYLDYYFDHDYFLLLYLGLLSFLRFILLCLCIVVHDTKMNE
jgi:hypothetical protein